MFLTNINQIRAIEWGRTYLWDIKFPDAPAPFNEWFPAVEIEENLATLESFDFEGFISTYKVPKSTTVFDLKVTFVDDIDHTLAHWLEEWINTDMLGEGNYILPLVDCCRKVMVAKLNLKRELIGHMKTYLVYPEGGLYFRGTSESGLPQEELTFIIAGVVKS
jgi:hypothetical protein